MATEALPVYTGGTGLVVAPVDGLQTSRRVEEKPGFEPVSSEPAATQPENDNSFAGLSMALGYFVLTVCQGIWIAFYIITDAHPNPRRFINSTTARWKAYQAFMYLFGAIHVIVNLGIWALPAVMSLGCGLIKAGTPHRRTKSVIAAIFLPLIAPFMIVLPVGGGPIISPFVKRQVYNHMCDPYGAQVVLDGRGYNQPLSVANTAQFYASESQQLLFTFELEQTNLSSAVFRFRGFDNDATTLPSGLVPTLRSISYDFDTGRLTGTCNNTAELCLDGSFDTGHLALDITSNITGTSVHSRSQSEYKQWVWSKDEPSLILRSLADDGMPSRKILQTVLPKVGDCTMLKACIKGSGGSLVGPEVLAPLGIILSKQVSHSNQCSRPRRGRS